jgi:hypothetical protein
VKDWNLELAGAVIFTIDMTLGWVALTYAPVTKPCQKDTIVSQCHKTA